MGLLKRKKAPESVIPTSTRLASLPREDLYLAIETCLMEAQMNLARLRTAPDEDKLAIIQWMDSNIKTALVATQEYASRI